MCFSFGRKALSLYKLYLEKMGISEGTMYPLLRRLTTEGIFTTYLKESSEGPPCKYYQITNVGKESLKAHRAEWQHFIVGVNELILEEEIG